MKLIIVAASLLISLVDAGESRDIVFKPREFFDTCNYCQRQYDFYKCISPVISRLEASCQYDIDIQFRLNDNNMMLTNPRKKYMYVIFMKYSHAQVQKCGLLYPVTVDHSYSHFNMTTLSYPKNYYDICFFPIVDERCSQKFIVFNSLTFFDPIEFCYAARDGNEFVVYWDYDDLNIESTQYRVDDSTFRLYKIVNDTSLRIPVEDAQSMRNIYISAVQKIIDSYYISEACRVDLFPALKKDEENNYHGYEHGIQPTKKPSNDKIVSRIVIHLRRRHLPKEVTYYTVQYYLHPDFLFTAVCQSCVNGTKTKVYCLSGKEDNFFVLRIESGVFTPFSATWFEKTYEIHRNFKRRGTICVVDNIAAQPFSTIDNIAAQFTSDQKTAVLRLSGACLVVLFAMHAPLAYLGWDIRLKKKEWEALNRNSSHILSDTTVLRRDEKYKHDISNAESHFYESIDEISQRS